MLILLCLLLALPAAAEEEPLRFVIRHGSRESKRIAITVDDFFDLNEARLIFDLAQQYKIPMTFFPLGQRILAEDADFWQQVAASNCEIGSHTYYHVSMAGIPARALLASLTKTQEKLDAVLGYHYPIPHVRPPFGKVDREGHAAIKSGIIRTMKQLGYEHVINWDVSQTDPKLAIKQVRGGSILLYHTRAKDRKCLETLIPQLLEAGFEPVTVSTLLGMDAVATSTDLPATATNLP